MSHRNRRLPLVSGALILLLLVCATAAGATILSANGTPRVSTLATPYVANDPALAFPITWQVNAPLPAPSSFSLPGIPVPFAPEGVIRSERGAFVLDTGSVQTLMESGGLLEAPVTGPVTSFSEIVRIPVEVVEEARRRGAQRILFVRTFQDEVRLVSQSPQLMDRTLPPTARPAAVAFYLSTTVGGPLSVFRLSLRFEDGEPLWFAHQGEQVQVWADIFYRGTGRIEGFWEIADASSTSGQPIFRPLQHVSRLLGGSSRVSLKGPRLPTNLPGLYEVRFRLTGDLATSFARYSEQPPRVLYQVQQDSPGVGPGAPKPITLAGPPTGAVLSADTSFAWASIRGAAAYQLELFERVDSLVPEGGVRRFDSDTQRYFDADFGGEETAFELASPERLDPGDRVAGVLLPPGEMQTALDSLTREHLQPGGRYLWRVIAFAPDGRHLGESELRPVRVPLPPASGAAAP